jgi:hypothetical protein
MNFNSPAFHHVLAIWTMWPFLTYHHFINSKNYPNNHSLMPAWQISFTNHLTFRDLLWSGLPFCISSLVVGFMMWRHLRNCLNQMQIIMVKIIEQWKIVCLIWMDIWLVLHFHVHTNCQKCLQLHHQQIHPF